MHANASEEPLLSYVHPVLFNPSFFTELINTPSFHLFDFQCTSNIFLPKCSNISVIYLSIAYCIHSDTLVPFISPGDLFP